MAVPLSQGLETKVIRYILNGNTAIRYAAGMDEYLMGARVRPHFRWGIYNKLLEGRLKAWLGFPIDAPTYFLGPINLLAMKVGESYEIIQANMKCLGYPNNDNGYANLFLFPAGIEPNHHTPKGGLESHLKEPLTNREFQVLELITEGLSNEEIAKRLYISIKTVKTHISSIYGKMYMEGENHRTAAALFFKKHINPKKGTPPDIPSYQSSQYSTDNIGRLTPRECDIFALIRQGLSNLQIAGELGISEKTVKNHITSILSKLGVRSRLEAGILAFLELSPTENPHQKAMQ